MMDDNGDDGVDVFAGPCLLARLVSVARACLRACQRERVRALDSGARPLESHRQLIFISCPFGVLEISHSTHMVSAAAAAATAVAAKAAFFPTKTTCRGCRN